MHPDRLASLGLRINVNRASEAELQALPGVGARLAHRIAESRPYAAPFELKRVRGIGPQKLSQLLPLVSTE
jgi:competence protein ComEA